MKYFLSSYHFYRTRTKWSLKILESCDRIKSNTLRINFDTVKKDKQERVYVVEEDLCQVRIFVDFGIIELNHKNYDLYPRNWKRSYVTYFHNVI